MTHPLFARPEILQLEGVDPAFVKGLRQSEPLQQWLRGDMRLDYWQTYNINTFASVFNGVVETVLRAMDLPAEVLNVARPSAAPAPRGGWYWPSAHGYDDRLELAEIRPQAILLRFYAQRQHHALEIRLAPPEPAQLVATQAHLADRAALLGVLETSLAGAAGLLEAQLLPTWRQWRLFASVKQPGVMVLGTGMRLLARLFALQPVALLVWQGVPAEEVVLALLHRELATFEAARQAALARLPVDPLTLWASVSPPPETEADPLAWYPPTEAEALAVMHSLPAAHFWPTPEENALLMAACEKTYKAVARKIRKLRQDVDDDW